MKILFKLLITVLLVNSQCHSSESMAWIDKETQRKVVQLSPEPFSTLPYFTVNAVSHDRRSMVYISAKGLHLLDLQTFTTTLLVAALESELQCIEMGRKSDRLFYLSKRRRTQDITLHSIHLHTKSITEHATLPPGYRIESINSDETLATGIREDQGSGFTPSPTATKGELLYARFKAKIPMTLFTVNLQSGAIKDLYRSTDWLSHPQFSPTNPSLLMYSHEGPWHQVDRIWTIRADGSERKLIHHRTMEMEITGHEFWSSDGSRIHYDWQRPKGKAFYFASYDPKTGLRTAAELTREQWSIHFNASENNLFFSGDGADSDQVSRSDASAGIFLYKLGMPHESGVWQTVTAEKLVDLRAHDYVLEPNARFTPDSGWVIFRSNMFGITSIFGVQVMVNVSPGLPVISTLDLAKKIQAERRRTLTTN